MWLDPCSKRDIPTETNQGCCTGLSESVKPSAIIFIGIQAVGKSIFYAHQFADTHVRINLDTLRTRHRESLLIRACIDAGKSFVIDNTNPSVADRRRYFRFLEGKGYRIAGYYFQSKIRDALARNSRREGPAKVPDLAIKGTASRLNLPILEEGFDELYYVKMIGHHEFAVEAWKHEV